MATMSIEVPLTSQVVVANMSPIKDEKIFYACRIDFEGLKCRKVNSPNEVVLNEWTRLCEISKTTPPWLVKRVLSFKCMPTSVIIEK
jgi:hypothetical protein